MRISLFLLLWIIVSQLGAQDIKQGSMKYSVNGAGTVALVECTVAQTGVLRVPSTIVHLGTSYRVNAIRSRALVGQGIATLVLPAQLDTIGQDAFYDCSLLMSVSGLKEVDVCEDYAFSRTSLKTLDWSQVTIGTMGHGVFAGCTQLTEALLPSQLTSLPEALFRDCTSLTSVNTSSLPLSRIDARAFAGCSSLQDLSLPSTLIEIGDEAFAGMTSLASISLPSSITTMGAYVFRGCTQLQTLQLPDELVTLGDSPFLGCSNLREVSLPKKLSGIDENFVFADCPVLESIKISDGAYYYSSIDGVLYDLRGNKIIAYPAARSRHTPPTLRTTSQPFAPGALMGCQLAPVLSLPAPTTSLPREVFAKTTGLQKVQTPSRSNLSTIESRAFAYSRDLTSVSLPAKLKTIGNAAFFGCSQISDVYTLLSVPPALTDSVFASIVYASAILHTPVGKADVYSAAPGWMLFQNIQDDGATYIEKPIAEEGVQTTETYDLFGRRVSYPVRGIYISNGHKTLIR